MRKNNNQVRLEKRNNEALQYARMIKQEIKESRYIKDSFILL